MRLLILSLCAAGFGLAGCAQRPLPPEVAARVCADRTGLAQRPRGTVGIGVGSGGLSSGVGVTVSPDFLMRRDPRDVYDACMIERAGFPPMEAQ